MIATIGILALGLAAVAAGLLLRRRLALRWVLSVCCAGVLLAALGGVLTAGRWDQTRQERSWSYLALCYLEQGQTEPAAQYLQKTTRQDVETVAAQLLLERLRGNETIARLRADGLQALARSQEDKTLSSVVCGVASGDYEGVRVAAQAVRARSPLSAGDRAKADQQFAAETGLWPAGSEASAAGQAELSEADALRSQVDQALRQGSDRAAVQSAARLVELEPKAANQLLLASAVAESVYSGDYLDAGCFASGEGELDATAGREREALGRQIAELETKQQELDLAIQGAGEEQAEALTAEKADLFARQEELQAESDYLYVQRALSAIAAIRSLEAEIVRARLYYSMRDYERAVDQLVDAAGSLQCRLSPASALTNGLNAVRRAYGGDSDTVGVESDQFRDTMVALLAAGTPQSTAVGTGELTQSFADRIVSDQKVYGKDLYATGIDLSAFPQVTLLLSGRDEALDRLLAGDGAVRDTRVQVDWEAELVAGEGAGSQICCVVDCSGSMGGEPMANLKQALARFAQSDLNGASTALVTFEDSAAVAAGLSPDPTRLQAAAQQLAGGGGTNITSGLSCALEVLEGVNGARTVLLMTDGQSSVDSGVVEQLASRGIVVHTIGFGQVDDGLLQSIADATGGQYIKADSSSELDNVYASLVGLIGNQLRIRYTAPDEDTTAGRYAYVTVGDGEEASLRLEYSLAAGETEDRGLVRIDPCFATTGQLAASAEGLPVTLWLDPTTPASRLTAVQVDGAEAAFQAGGSADRVTVALPAGLAAGGHSFTLVWDDGVAQTYEELFFVGDALRCDRFRLGWLEMRGEALLTGDGRLVITDPALQNLAGDQADRTLSLRLEGRLVLTVDPAALLAADGAWQGGDPLSLGESGLLEGWGYRTLASGDSAANGATPELNPGGRAAWFQVECTPEQARFLTVPQEGGGNDGTVPQE